LVVLFLVRQASSCRTSRPGEIQDKVVETRQSLVLDEEGKFVIPLFNQVIKVAPTELGCASQAKIPLALQL